VKVGKLQINKETIKELTNKEAEQIKGGLPQGTLANRAHSDCCTSCAPPM
jgi:hypothetical protein